MIYYGPGPRLIDFRKVFEKDLVKLQADIGETLIRIIGPMTPRKTGRLRASWEVNSSGNLNDVGPGTYHIFPQGRVEVPAYDISYVTNGVPYGGLVDQGIGMSYPRNFVRPAIKRTVRRFN